MEKCGKAADLRGVLENSAEDVSTELLLDRWRKEMLSTGTQPRHSSPEKLSQLSVKRANKLLLHLVQQSSVEAQVAACSHVITKKQTQEC